MGEDWTAGLGDYGVLRVQTSSGTMVTTTVAGTQEYMDYDYVTSGIVSDKTDVYSFGVVSNYYCCYNNTMISFIIRYCLSCC